MVLSDIELPGRFPYDADEMPIFITKPARADSARGQPPPTRASTGRGTTARETIGPHGPHGQTGRGQIQTHEASSDPEDQNRTDESMIVGVGAELLTNDDDQQLIHWEKY